MPERRILVVDDDAVFRSVLATELTDMGFQAAQCDGKGVMEHLVKHPVDVVLLDIVMPDLDGFSLLESIRTITSPPEVVMLTGYASLEKVLQALRLGARDFLIKPVDRQELDRALKNCFNIDHGIRRKSTSQRPRPAGPLDQMIGHSGAMQKVRNAISRYAACDSTVLIQGESGTGKELVAQLVHRHSPRSHGPFLIVDCTTLAEQLLASELFGYEKGSFTGAVQSHQGILSMAEGGCALLDEIGDMAPALQVKLLRVVETKTFRPVGGHKSITVNVRILAATNSDLNEAVREGHFRNDLYYRLAICRIDIPPLRDHVEDIPLLVDYFCSKLARSSDRAPVFSPAALRKLACYHWPGNVRELRNLVDQMAIHCGGKQVEPEDIDFDRVTRTGSETDSENGPWPPLRHLESDYIRDVLTRSGGNKSAAARALGIDRKTLSRRLRNRPGDE